MLKIQKSVLNILVLKILVLEIVLPLWSSAIILCLIDTKVCSWIYNFWPRKEIAEYSYIIKNFSYSSISILYHNFDFCVTISIFDYVIFLQQIYLGKNFYFWAQFRHLAKFRFLTKFWLFTSLFWPNCHFFITISTIELGQNFDAVHFFI